MSRGLDESGGGGGMIAKGRHSAQAPGKYQKLHITRNKNEVSDQDYFMADHADTAGSWKVRLTRGKTAGLHGC